MGLKRFNTKLGSKIVPNLEKFEPYSGVGVAELGYTIDGFNNAERVEVYYSEKVNYEINSTGYDIKEDIIDISLSSCSDLENNIIGLSSVVDCIRGELKPILNHNKGNLKYCRLEVNYYYPLSRNGKCYIKYIDIYSYKWSSSINQGTLEKEKFKTISKELGNVENYLKRISVREYEEKKLPIVFLDNLRDCYLLGVGCYPNEIEDSIVGFLMVEDNIHMATWNSKGGNSVIKSCYDGGELFYKYVEKLLNWLGTNFKYPVKNIFWYCSKECRKIVFVKNSDGEYTLVVC